MTLCCVTEEAAQNSWPCSGCYGIEVALTSKQAEQIKKKQTWCMMFSDANEESTIKLNVLQAHIK